MVESQWLTLLGTPATIAFGVALVLAVMVFSWLAIQRTGFKRSTMLLELLRVLVAIAVAFTLNQPEWLQKFLPEEDPVLAVLWDDSQSMVSADVFESEDKSGKPLTRADWLKPLLADEIWQRVGENVKVVKVPFNSSETGPSGTDINEALQKVTAEHKNLRGVVIMSDGDWNTGKSPTVGATQLRLQKVPVYTVAIGSDEALPDLEAFALDAPTFGVINKPTRIPFVINSTLPTGTAANVILTSSDGDQLTKTIQIRANSRYEDAFVWRPMREGEYTLTLDLPPEETELNRDNNSISVPISIRKESLKILIVDSFPRWEFRYLRNALLRDPGVEVRTLLFHPKLDNVGGGLDYIEEFPVTKEELSKFDVILLGDVGVGDKQLSYEDCRNIRGMVENQATGLVFLPGFRGNQFSLLTSELEGLYPVHLDEIQTGGWGSRVPAQLSLTESGRLSLLTKLADTPELNASVWRGLPGFQWYAPVTRAKSGTQTLAVHATEANDDGRIPLLVTKTFGAGKILFLGTDGAWRWREGVEDKYHYRFWGQVARWMAYQRNMAGGDNMRLFYSPDRPKVGQTISLSANVMDSYGEPLRSGSVKVQVVSPSGDSQQINLAPASGGSEWGLFTGTFSPTEDGLHQAIVTCRENSSTLDTTITVLPDKREKIGKPINSEALAEVADITGGKMLTTNNFQSLFRELTMLPQPEPRIKRIRIWAHPAWASSFILLLCVFWIGRKLNGMI